MYTCEESEKLLFTHSHWVLTEIVHDVLCCECLSWKSIFVMNSVSQTHTNTQANTRTPGHTRAHTQSIHCSTEINWNDRIICCRRLFSSNISTLRFALLLYLLLKVNIIPKIWAQDCVLFSLCDRCWYDSCYLFALFSVFVLIFGVL